MSEVKWDELVEECKKIAEERITSTQNGTTCFHNWEHTQNVYNAVKEIGSNTQEVDEKQICQLQIAALFHDLTACEKLKGHESVSSSFAKEFLIEKGVEEADAEVVERLILATCLSHHPTDLLEEIMKDADLSHLKNKDYIRNQFINLYKELSEQLDKSPKDWITECIEFFARFPFRTDYAKDAFAKGRKKNQNRLIELNDMDIESLDELEKKVAKKKKKKDKVVEPAGKGKAGEKGVETMFRVALRNHVNLSRIADDKANTLISVNAIIISIVLSTLFPKLDNNPYLLFPALTLVVFNITTIIISIVSTIPRTTHGLMTKEDVNNKRGNLIFFGNFHKMEVNDFEWGMDELMKDKEYLYKSLTRDLYYLGIVLNKKYTYLRVGYITFVFGLLAGIIAFVVSLSLHGVA